MYLMNDDFFDEFTVLFTSDEVVIEDEHYPLGSFAAEFLNLDKSVLRVIEQLVPVLKEQLTVFFAARDTSTAAEAQQTINRIWAQLLQLPVCRLFARPDMSHQHLMRYLLLHSDETDDVMTTGSERNQAYQRWMQRLERFTDSISAFIRNTIFMLDGYFNDLTERRPDAYAQAFTKYHSAARAQFEMDVERKKETGSIEPVEHIEALYPTNLSFVSVRSAVKSRGFILAERMTFEDLASFLYVELYKGMAAGHIPRRCHHCGRWFLLTAGYDIRYCTNIAPGETKRTCKQVGAHRKEKEKIGNDFVRREYSKLYNRLKQRKNRGAITVDEWNRQIAKAQEIKAQALCGEIGEAEFLRWFGKI